MTTPAVSAVTQGASNVRQIPNLPKLPQEDVSAIIAQLQAHNGQAALAQLQAAVGRAHLPAEQVETIRHNVTETMQRILNDASLFNPPLNPDQRAVMAATYALMMGSGGFVQLGELANPNMSDAERLASRARMQLILQTTAAVWRGGRSTNSDIGARPRLQRLDVFVGMWSNNLNDIAKGRPVTFPMLQEALNQARNAVLDPVEFAQPSQAVFASVAQMGYAPDARRARLQVAPAQMARAAVGPVPAGSAASYAAALPQMQPPVAPGQRAPSQVVPIGQVHSHQGTMLADNKTPWTPENVARALVANSGFRARIDLLTGLTMKERWQVGEAYARIRDDGKGYMAGQALAFMIQDLGQNASREDAKIYADMLRPSNSEGFVSDHIMIYLDATGGNWLSSLTGIGGANDKAIQRVLVHRTPEQIAEIDRLMQETYHKSLVQVIGEVEDTEARKRLLFYANCNVRDSMGEIPQAEQNAWDLREAMHNFTIWQQLKNKSGATAVSDWNRLYRTLEGMTNWQVREAAAAYYRQIIAEGGKPDGNNGLPDPVTGALPELSDSALGRALVAQSQDAINFTPNKALAKQRMEIAIHGLAFAPPPPPVSYPGESEANFAQRNQMYQQALAQIHELSQHQAGNLGRYASISFQLAGDKELSTEDVQGVMSLLQANVAPGQQLPDNGRPLLQDVLNQFRVDTKNPSDNPDKVLDELVRYANASISSADQERNTRFYLAGMGADAAALRGARLADTLPGPAMGLLGPLRQQTYDLLDLSSIPEEQRETYRQQMYDAYAAATKGHNLYQDVIAKFGATMTTASGQQIPTLAARLVTRGIATSAEKIFTALHERALFGLTETNNLPRVSAIVDKLTPLERVVTRMEYKRLTGCDLLEELKNSPELDARMASLALRVSKADIPMVAAEAQMYFGANGDNPALAAKRAQALGRDPNAVNDFLLRNLYDYRRPQANAAGVIAASPTVQAVTDAINQRGGAMAFARSVADSVDDMNQAVGEANDKALGNAVTRGIQNIVSNDGKTLTIEGKKLEELSRRAGDELDRLGYIRATTQEDMVATVIDLKARLRKRGVDVSKATDLVANLAVTAAILTTSAVAPALSPLWVAAISGATGLGTRLALDQVHSLAGAAAYFIRDAAKGYGAANTISLMNMAYNMPDLSLFELGLFGASAGVQQGATIALGEIMTNPQIRYDQAQGYVNSVDMYTAFLGRDAVVGFATAELFGLFSGKYNKQDNQQPPANQQPPNQSPGSSGQPPGGSGQPPGSPSRPTQPDRPVNPKAPGQPTGDPSRPTRPDRPVSPKAPGQPTGGPGPTSGPLAGRPGDTHLPNTSGSGTVNPVVTRPGDTHLPNTSGSGTTNPSLGRPGTFGPGTGNTPSPATAQPTRPLPSTGAPATNTTPSRIGDPVVTSPAPVTGLPVRPVGGSTVPSSTLVPSRGGTGAGAGTMGATPSGAPAAPVSTVSTPVSPAAVAARPTGSASAINTGAPVAGRSTRSITITTDSDRQDASQMIHAALSPGLPARVGPQPAGFASLPLGSTRAMDIASTGDATSTLDAATLTWGAVAVSSAVTLASTDTPARRALRDYVERQMPGTTNKVAEILRAMSADERATAMQGFSGVFAASALAYARQNDGRLPGNEGDNSRFSQLLDIAYQNTGVGVRGADVSRMKKLHAILAAADGVPPEQISLSTGVIPGQGPAAPANGPDGQVLQVPGSPDPARAQGQRRGPRPQGARPAARAPIAPAPGPGPIAPAPAPAPADTPESMAKAIHDEIGQIRGQQGAGDPGLYIDLAARLDKLNRMNGRSQQEYDALIAEYADLVRKPGDGRDGDRQGRLTSIVAATQRYPDVLSPTFTQMMQGEGALTPKEKLQLAVDAAAPFFHRQGVIDPMHLPLAVTRGIDRMVVTGPVPGASDQLIADYNAAAPAIHMMSIQAQLNDGSAESRSTVLRSTESEWMIRRAPWILSVGLQDTMFDALHGIDLAATPDERATLRLEVANAMVNVINSEASQYAALTLQSLAQKYPETARDIAATIWSPDLEKRVKRTITQDYKTNFAVALAISQLPTEAGKIGHPAYDPETAPVHPFLSLLTTSEDGMAALKRIREDALGQRTYFSGWIKDFYGHDWETPVRHFIEKIREQQRLDINELIARDKLPFARNKTAAELAAEAQAAAPVPGPAPGAAPAPGPGPDQGAPPQR